MTSMELQKMDVTATVVCKSKSKECEGSLARIEGEFEKIQVKNRGNLIIVVGPTAFDAILRKLLGSGRKKPRQQGIPHLACVLLERALFKVVLVILETVLRSYAQFHLFILQYSYHILSLICSYDSLVYLSSLMTLGPC
ncbi:unnamed protein product [Nippostrongylus brasiliensis]|uniref:HMA domain-containing protein n=1 Tax=Nippostrongylus brasiliensis TaxID=27835 RepID=A0A158R3P8_NIPBR|nr:unnamed protein product [Nippostrongylus brasiliensis]